MIPTAPRERVERIDVLRGFALSGVLLANLPLFSGDVYLTPGQQMQPMRSGVLSEPQSLPSE